MLLVYSYVLLWLLISKEMLVCLVTYYPFYSLIFTSLKTNQLQIFFTFYLTLIILLLLFKKCIKMKVLESLAKRDLIIFFIYKAFLIYSE
jgi:hypothetical protein